MLQALRTKAPISQYITIGSGDRRGQVIFPAGVVGRIFQGLGYDFSLCDAALQSTVCHSMYCIYNNEICSGGYRSAHLAKEK